MAWAQTGAEAAPCVCEPFPGQREELGMHRLAIWAGGWLSIKTLHQRLQQPQGHTALTLSPQQLGFLHAPGRCW